MNYYPKDEIENDILSRRKSAPSLYNISQDFILKYTLQVIWRQVDPSDPSLPRYHLPRMDAKSFALSCPLPRQLEDIPKSQSKEFRRRLLSLRDYFSTNLVRPLHEALAEAATTFVGEHRLRYGEILLRVAFLDNLSKSFELKAKHIIWRRWSSREVATLHRSIVVGEKLTKFVLPGKCTDKILALLAEHCPLLEHLDLSLSYVSNAGLLRVAGVEVSGNENIHKSHQLPGPSGSYVNGRYVRASAARAINIINKIKQDPQKIVEIREKPRISGRSLSVLAEKMKPFILKNDGGTVTSNKRWSVRPGVEYSFSRFGCRKLKHLDLYRTNYPRRRSDSRGNLLDEVGITSESVLAILLLLDDLEKLEWTDLGEVLQLYESVFVEVGLEPRPLRLTYLTDMKLSLGKLEVARKLCPKIGKIEVSMFNFNTNIGTSDESENKELCDASKLFFDFEKIFDLDIVYLDDNDGLSSALRISGIKLTSLSLTKMMSLCFETIALVKENCKNLRYLEIYTDKVYGNSYSGGIKNLEEIVEKAANFPLPCLKNLKFGGLIESGSVLKYLMKGCDSLRVLCYHVYEEQSCHITDTFVQEVLGLNSLKLLVAFYLENCRLTEETFYTLITHLPKLKLVGVLSEWEGLTRKGRDDIVRFIERNNLDIELDDGAADLDKILIEAERS